MSEETKVDDLLVGLTNLTMAPGKAVNVGKANIKDTIDFEENQADHKSTSDDGYKSSDSVEDFSGLEATLGKLDIQKVEEEEEDDEEKILEPLVIVDEEEEEGAPTSVEWVSRGAVARDSAPNRFQPYSRQHVGSCLNRRANNPLPKVYIYRNGNRENPTLIDAKVEWLETDEVCIDHYRLPEDVSFSENTTKHIKVFVQLDPNVRVFKDFNADVKYKADESGRNYAHIGPIIISLKKELAQSYKKLLLENLKAEDLAEADVLVRNKDIGQLVQRLGPHKDTTLSILCKLRRPETSLGMMNAQVYHVTQRLSHHPEESVRNTIFIQNSNRISALEIAAVSNNSLVACYLAEVMYHLIEDTATALEVLNCKDDQGNTIIHMLVRKGDSNIQTLKQLMGMCLTDGTLLFAPNPNVKKQSPMHIAARGENHRETIRLLQGLIPHAFELQDEDGMIPLHYACSTTTDPSHIENILSYKNDNINHVGCDGLTALDVVLMRTANPGDRPSAFDIEPVIQIEIVKILRNNGGLQSTQLNLPQSPYGSLDSPYNGFRTNASPPNTVHDDGSVMTASPRTVHDYGSVVSSSPRTVHDDGSVVSASPHTVHDAGSVVSSSPRTVHDDGSVGGLYFRNRMLGSVESYVQSSPESDHGEQQHAGGVRNYSFMSQVVRAGHTQEASYQGRNGEDHRSPDTTLPAGSTFTDHLASQILTEFPEVGNMLGQILDGNL